MPHQRRCFCLLLFVYFLHHPYVSLSLSLSLVSFRKLDFEHVISFIVQYVQSVKFVSAIQKTLALEIFVALVYRMSVFISAAYFVSKFKQARLEAEAGIRRRDDEEIVSCSFRLNIKIRISRFTDDTLDLIRV